MSVNVLELVLSACLLVLSAVGFYVYRSRKSVHRENTDAYTGGKLRSDLTLFAQVLGFLGKEVGEISNSMAGDKENLKVQASTITASSEQINQNVKAVSSATLFATEASKGANQAAERALAQMNTLSEEARDIDDILQTIASVAKQTHLLSINASIEAAQAGKYGAGFNVIAEEVRTLASQTKDASEAIEEKVRRVQTVIAQALELTEHLRDSNRTLDEINQTIARAVGSCEEGGEVASRTHDKDKELSRLQEIIASNSDIAKNVSAVHGNLKEMSCSINQLNEETFLSQKSGRDLNRVIGNLQTHLRPPGTVSDRFHVGLRGINASNTRIRRGDTIRIGVIYSQTGVMGVVERDQYKVAMMFINRVNRNGGIHGARLEAVVRDPASVWDNYARYARELVDQGVRIFWACYTSASRESILPVIEESGSVLFYPTYYEGRECSPNVIITGSCPNQQVANSIPWMMRNFGPKAYFVGSDYIYPRTMHATSKHLLRDEGGELLGDRYISLDAEEESRFHHIVEDIRRVRPDWVFSNVVGASCIAFMRAYYKAGLTAETLPILSCPLTEPEVAATGVEYCLGHYTSFTYFQTVRREENRRFVRNFQDFVRANPRWKDHSNVTSGVMQSSFVGMMACAQAMNQSGSWHPRAIIEACRGMKIAAPEGDVVIDRDTQHAWLRPRIGQVRGDGLFDIVEESDSIVRPMVFDPHLDSDRECRLGGQLFIDGTQVLPRDVEMTGTVPVSGNSGISVSADECGRTREYTSVKEVPRRRTEMAVTS